MIRHKQQSLHDWLDRLISTQVDRVITQRPLALRLRPCCNHRALRFPGSRVAVARPAITTQRAAASTRIAHLTCDLELWPWISIPCDRCLWPMHMQQEALLLQRDRARHLSEEILQLQNISLENPIVWHYLRDSTFSRFDTIPECDRHTHWQTDRHTTTAYTALSIASRSKNRPYCTAHQL